MKKYIILILSVFIINTVGFAQSQNKIDSLKNLINTAKDDTSKIKLVYNLGRIYENNLPDTAIYYYNVALSISIKTDSKKYAAICLGQIGNVYYLVGEFEKAIEFTLKSLAIYESIDKQKGISMCYKTLGDIYSDQGIYGNALHCYMKSLKIREKIGDKKGELYCYIGIGYVDKCMGNESKAIASYSKAMKIAFDYQEKYAVSTCYSEIGVIYLSQGSINKALEFVNKSLKIDEELDNISGIASGYANLGNIQKAKGEYSQALEYFLKSLKIAEEIGDLNSSSNTLSSIADVYIKMKLYNEAIKYAMISLKIAKEESILPEQSFNYESLAVAYDSLHDYKNACIYYKLYKQINDSIFNEESHKQITEMQTKYETEKKESKIKILEKDKELQSTQLSRERWVRNLSLAGMGLMFLLIIGAFFYIRVWRVKEKIATEKKIIELEQKSLLLQMNPHFIFNSLNSISAQMLQNLNVAREYLAKFARLMRLILENSREAFVPMKNETDTINFYLALEQQRLNNFDYKVIIDEDITSENIEIPPMLIQPHVENAIIHGIFKKQDRGYIEVHLSKTNENLIKCVVQDNGIGRKKSGENKDNLLITHKSLALEITQERLKMLSHGNKEALTVIIDDMEDELHNSLGTRVTIKMPYRLI